MRNIAVADFDVRRLHNINGCEVFCVNCQTLYIYNKGLIVKYNKIEEEIICNLKDTLYRDYEDLPPAIEIVYYYEKDLLYLILSNGDIISITPNGGGSETIVGFVEDGIKAAQWSPEQEVIALINGVDNVIVLTNDFDPVSEVNIHCDGFGEKQNVSVGWGKKETQFHGSIGKYVAQENPEEIQCEKNSNKIRISWRGDAEYFVVSSANPKTNLRYLRIFSKNGTLQYTSENIKGLEDSLDWCPSGNLIVSTQKLPNKYNVCFFEKNGLRHGDFSISENVGTCTVNEMLWSKDSRILAAIISNNSENIGLNNTGSGITHKNYIQFFTISNYKWYCKYTINLDILGEPLGVKWDHQKLNVFHIIMLRNSNVYHFKYTWVWITNKTTVTRTEDESFVAVIDGCNIHLTSFKKGITPPPMCNYSIKTMGPANSILFAPESNDFTIFLSNGNILIYKYFNLSHELVGVIDSLNTESEICYNCHWLGLKKFACCMFEFTAELQNPFIKVIEFEEVTSNIKSGGKRMSMQTTIAFVRVTKSGAILYDNSGKLYSYKNNAFSEISRNISPGVVELDVMEKEDGSLFVFCLDGCNKFYINSNFIFNNILSFHIHDKFVLLTNMKHELLCINSDSDSFHNDSYSEVFKRKVERGSRLITSVQKDMKVILQMPRGNLECIQPRALSIYTIGKYLDEIKYSEAFSMMRKQRINLNLIYDHNPSLFENNVEAFIKQIADVQWICLFISDIIPEDVTQTMYSVIYKNKKNNEDSTENSIKVDIICDLIEKALSKMGISQKYLLPILTCHIKRNKIEYLEAALSILKNLKEKESNSGISFDEAFKYILYLIDVDEIYNIALGMYDFDLVLMVANKSQKDPKEYLPFLNDLKKLEPNYQKFAIDKYLKRYKKALTHLIKCQGDAASNECLSFIKAHKLFKFALKLIPVNTEKYKCVCISYGEDLMESHFYEEAGLMFSTVGQYKRAIDAYKKSGNWQEVISCAMELEFTESELNALHLELAKNLFESKQFMNAAIIYFDYLKDAEEGLRILCNGKLFAEAYRICRLHNHVELINKIIVPSILQHANTMLLQIAEFREILIRQCDRLQLVRKKKQEDSVNKSEFDAESDIYSEASTIITQSDATSRGTNRTYRSAKNKRKQERKLLSLKEGSRYEDLALVVALHNLITNCIGLMSEVKDINKFLIKINNTNLAEKIQTNFDDLINKVENLKPKIWNQDFMYGRQFGPDTASNEAAAMHIWSENVTPVILHPKYSTPPENPINMKWKLEIVNN